MKSTRNPLIYQRFMRVLTALILIAFAGQSTAHAYQFPSKQSHRQFRIFIPASASSKKVVPVKTKAIVIQNSAKALIAVAPQPTTFASAYTGPKIDVSIQATATPTTTFYGDGTNPTIGCNVSQPQYLEGPAVATLYNSDGVTLASPITATTPANTLYIVKCAIKPSPSAAINGATRAEYVNAIFYDTQFIVLPRPLTITAVDKTIFVGATPSVAVNVAGLVNGDTVTPESVTYETNSIPAQTITPSTAPFGTYNIVPSPVNFTQGLASNYNVTYVNGTLQINSLTNILISPTVDANTSTFGSSSNVNVSFTSTNTSQLSVLPTCSLYSDAAHTNVVTISNASDAGTYYAYCSGAVAKDGFTVSYTSDPTFTINPLPVTITAATPTAIAHGATLPINSITTAPALVGSDSISSITYTYSQGNAATPAVTPSASGLYWINPNNVLLNSGRAANYLFTYAHGTLTINPVVAPPVVIPPVVIPPSGCATNCRQPEPQPQPQPPVVIPVEPIPVPTLTQVAKPIVVTTKPKTTIVPKKRFTRTGMQSDRVANFVKISNVTGKMNSVKIPHDKGTKVQLTDGVAANLKEKLKLEITEEGINITAVNGWTGRISVPVVVTQNGVLVELFIAVVEVPAPVLYPKFYLDDLQSATIKWQPDGSQVVFYNVYLGSQLLCTTPSTMCTQVGNLNTQADLHIEAVGHQSTFSTQVSPVYTSSKLIPATVVHFDTAKSLLKPYEQSLLDDLVMAARNMGLRTIYITGHTDSTGNYALNVKLSQARSTAVKKYVEKFFPNVTIIWKGFASNTPVSSNSTNSGRENNRRAEVSVG